jgi:hypothetical protein
MGLLSLALNHLGRWWYISAAKQHIAEKYQVRSVTLVNIYSAFNSGNSVNLLFRNCFDAGSAHT